MKLDLFDSHENILPYKGEVYFYPNFFDEKESGKIYSEFLKEVPWKQEPIVIFGNEVMQPRLTAWYGNDGRSYSYSGITMQALSWSKTLLMIKEKVEKLSGQKFNSALLNYYRDGNDSMGW